jgi:Tfp pilus assembly protein FimT
LSKDREKPLLSVSIGIAVYPDDHTGCLSQKNKYLITREQTRKPDARHGGYSLVELMIALILVMILAAFAIPNMATAIATLKLRGSASDFAGLVQLARTTAIRKNVTFTILFNLAGVKGAYVDLSGNGSFDTGEPMIQFGGNANQVAAPGGASGAPTNLDAASGLLGWTASSGNISFNARGLPCDSGVNPCGTNVNYITYFEDTRSFGANGWAAVSITSAGRAKVWWWNGSAWTD